MLVVWREAAADPVVLVDRSAASDAVDCAPFGVEGVRAPFVDGPAEDPDGRVVLLELPFASGARRLVERLRISLPLTTRLSLDLRRSLVIISDNQSARVMMTE